MPRRLIRKRCRYSSLDKFEDAIDTTLDFSASFGDSRLNSGRIIRLRPAGPVLRTFVWYSVAFCSRPEAANDVFGRFMRQIVFNKCVKVRDPCFNRSHERPPVAARQSQWKSGRKLLSFLSSVEFRLAQPTGGLSFRSCPTFTRHVVRPSVANVEACDPSFVRWSIVKQQTSV